MEYTDDGRFIIIAGRRWRATDPDIPAERAETLRKDLMRARRDVASAQKSGDVEAEKDARRRVQRSKVALGERGTPWWEQTIEQRRARWSDCAT